MSQYKIRKGCKDVWNSYMCSGADFSKSMFDIPFCPTTAVTIPKSIILWDEAKRIYKKNIKRKKKFRYDAFVCFYQDDYKFDGKQGIWQKPKELYRVLCHFAGVITPDYSTYQDFPEPIKIYNTYRMRTLGYWLGKNGIPVINNVRWGTSESWKYCWDGIPTDSIVAIGTVGGSPYKKVDRKRFIEGLYKLVEVLRPHTIIVYGSANYKCFDELAERGIRIIQYPSRTSLGYERRLGNE